MGSSHFGELSLGNGRSGSSRKGKKSNSDKPKQPQRGLGVAQLEQIRLRNQMGRCYLPSLPSGAPHTNPIQEDVAVEMAFAPSASSSSSSSSSYPPTSSFGFHPKIMMSMGETETTDIGYGDTQASVANRLYLNNGIMQPQLPSQTSVTRHFLGLPIEDSSQKKRRDDRCDSMGSSSQNSESSDTQELDLDLKL